MFPPAMFCVNSRQRYREANIFCRRPSRRRAQRGSPGRASGLNPLPKKACFRTYARLRFVKTALYNCLRGAFLLISFP